MRPVVTPELLAHPPAHMHVRLAGAPSLRALRATGGRALEASAEAGAALRPRLEADTAEAPRLVQLAGQPPVAAVDVGPDGRVELVFDGVLDPASVTPQACALRAMEGGLVLPEPVLPEVSWSCTERRFTIELRVPAGAGVLQFALRHSGLRGLSGRAPEPALVVDLRTPR